MGYKQTWSCDHCNHEQISAMSPRPLYEVTVAATRADRHSGAYYIAKTMLCDQCLTKHKLYNPEPVRNESVIVPTTFEEALRIIIREEIEAKE